MKRAAAIKRFLLALFILLLILGLAVIFLPSGGGSIGHTVTFSDGTTMTLKAVTYGTEHRYLGGGWQQRLLSLLPRKVAAKLARRQGELTVDRPSVAFWFEKVGTGPSTGTSRFALRDTSGFGVWGQATGMKLISTGQSLEGWAFESWPCHEHTFALCVYEQDDRYPEAKAIGEFTVRNPRPSKYPVWTGPELPVTAREGELSVTLFDLTAGVGLSSNAWKAAANPTVCQTRAGFRIERNAQPTKEWAIASVEASDATSNAVAGIRETWRTADADYVGLEPHLWPAEQPWKLRVGLSQQSNFLASELWILRNMRLSRPDLMWTPTNLPSAVLVYTGPPRRSELPGNQGFYVDFNSDRTDYSVTVVNAVDDKGREAKVAGWFVESPGPRRSEFTLRVHTNATTLDLTLALHQIRYVEFLVRPRIISTNETASR